MVKRLKRKAPVLLPGPKDNDLLRVSKDSGPLNKAPGTDRDCTRAGVVSQQLAQDWRTEQDATALKYESFRNTRSS